MSANSSLKTKTLAGLFWSFFERIGAQLVSFVVSIILARLLMPEEYGAIAIVLVFINICDVFVNSGFAQALVQKKDADETDFSTVFYFNILFSAVLYVILYVIAPFVAQFYEMEILMPVIRVLGIRVFFSSINSVQKAMVSRLMQFKKFFFSTLGGTLISAVIGIGMAYLGYGIWSLVAQNLANAIVNTVILFITVRWRPHLLFSFEKLKVLFRYGWKILVAGLISVLYEDFRSLYVGKLYTADDLAYYTRGKQFPHLVIDNVNTSISSVLFPAISKSQGDLVAVKAMTRRAIKTSTYILTPLLMGLAAVAEPLVLLLLTEKWLPCVPFLQILCINCALMPLQTANLQAINALGRSDIALKLEIVKKSFGFLMVLVFARISVLAMAWAGVATGVVALILNTSPNKKLLNYGIFEQLKDILPSWIMSFVMMGGVMAVSLLSLPVIVELMLMIVAGVVIYVALSLIFKVESFMYLWATVKPMLGRFLKKKS